MKPIDRVRQALESRGPVHQRGKELASLCYAHGDHNESLTTSEADDGKVLLCCHAGCTFEAILASLGLVAADTFPLRTETPAATKSRIVATYQYFDAAGALAYEICRFVPKDFRPRRRGSDGKWLWNLKGIDRIPYNLPQVLSAPADCPRFIMEGEKDCDNAVKLGLVATTNPGGCGSTKLWAKKAFQEPFRGRDVVIIPDRDDDEVGEKHARFVARSLAGVARSIKVVRL